MAATNYPLFANTHFTQSVIKSQWTRGSPYIPITKAGGAVISPFSVFYENILSRSRRWGAEGLARQIELIKCARSQRQWALSHTVTNSWTCAPTVYPIRKNNTGKGEATCYSKWKVHHIFLRRTPDPTCSYLLARWYIAMLLRHPANENGSPQPRERCLALADRLSLLDFWLLTGLTYFTVNTNSIATTAVLFGVRVFPSLALSRQAV